jgi:hypothetical protein
MLPEVFIQPGGLQGEATMRSCGLIASAGFENGQQVGAVRLDGKMREIRIRLAARRVIEAVVSEREIRCADRDAGETQSEPAVAAEQFLEQGRPLRLVRRFSMSQALESVTAAPKPTISW